MTSPPPWLERIRRNTPNFDRDHAAIEVALRDCAMAYFWNPIVAPHEYEYTGLGTTLYAGIDDETRTAWIVFRGTDKHTDWLVNFFFVPLPLPHPMAHGGFVLSWKLAKRRFVPWLRSHKGRFDRIFITGHSLGGALALACAYELQDEGFEVAQCITVGMPRLYTAWSVKKVENLLGDRFLRVVKDKDVVPKVPPALLGFRHMGKPWRYVRELMGETAPDPFPRLSHWLGNAWYWLSGGPVGEWIEKHTGVNMEAQLMIYIAALLASFGGGFSLLAQGIEWSMVGLFAVSIPVLLVSGSLIAFGAHLSGKYAATRSAASMLDEWQNHHMRQLAQGLTPHATGAGMVSIEVSTVISKHHGADAKRRFIRNVRRFFGKATFRTALVRSMETTLAEEVGSRALPFDKLPLEHQLRGTCAALRLHGYSSEEIDRMIASGLVHRPAAWSRYYARWALSGEPSSNRASSNNAPSNNAFSSP